MEFSKKLNETEGDDRLRDYEYMGYPYDVQAVMFVRENTGFSLFLQSFIFVFLAMTVIAIGNLMVSCYKDPSKYKFNLKPLWGDNTESNDVSERI